MWSAFTSFLPLILVPQLLLGGAMIKFDDFTGLLQIRKCTGTGRSVDTRWAYEAVMVEGFISNKLTGMCLNIP
jgi:hypothetical protein